MIEFKVTGETWKEILGKLEGMLVQPDSAPLSEEPVIETTEEPTDEFKPEWKEPEPPIDPSPPALPVLLPASSPALPNPAYNVPGIELDSTGSPWNPSIHTRTQAKNDDGSWKFKRKTPGFPKKSGPVKPEPGKVATPIIPPSLRIDDFTKFAVYATKINTEKNLKDNIIRDYLISIGIPNILQIPKEKLPEVAETLKTHFGVEF